MGSSLTGAVNQMRRDYAQEQADDAREQHDLCPAAGDAATAQNLASQHGC